MADRRKALTPSNRKDGDRDDLEHVVEPPVVARLVVEIRSDGTRTIARGGLEDVVQGQKVAIEATGTSPMQLALALAKSMTQLPRFAMRLSAKDAVRGLLGRRKK